MNTEGGGGAASLAEPLRYFPVDASFLPRITHSYRAGSDAPSLQEETGRLRDALKVASREADRADRLENDLTKSEVRENCHATKGWWTVSRGLAVFRYQTDVGGCVGAVYAPIRGEPVLRLRTKGHPCRIFLI